ncbi:hypothetical protein [Xanthomonas oryzae]|uniref:hypothetical protein n=1 Tax=Xanthomonas oryzae TaxID=347 RepID=UPI001E448A25|nr:hypothetical protein [Xanthomonas oryzae]UEG98439.1 hypothetical protein LLC55_06635 [Xanthomonas oryzae pv. oryzae]UEQ24097.1 hypothetical protein LNP58_02495 [Xanthomonas oryzae pv. oryzae]
MKADNGAGSFLRRCRLWDVWIRPRVSTQVERRCPARHGGQCRALQIFTSASDRWDGTRQSSDVLGASLIWSLVAAGMVPFVAVTLQRCTDVAA